MQVNICSKTVILFTPLIIYRVTFKTFRFRQEVCAVNYVFFVYVSDPVRSEEQLYSLPSEKVKFAHVWILDLKNQIWCMIYSGHQYLNTLGSTAIPS